MSFFRGFTVFGGRISHPMLVVVLLLGLVMMWAFLATARTKPMDDYHKWWLYGTDTPSLGKIADEGDKPTAWMISWIGAGDFRTYTISNCGQSGYFEPPPNWQYYDGTFPNGFGSGNGYLGEFPAGSRQFYNWAAGIWVGAPYPKVIGDDTLWQPRVTTGAYYSDIGAMSHLEQSNERIPEGEEGEGDYRFWQRGKPDTSYQESWPHADTALNALRVAAGGDPLDPANGDYISLEDTWAVMGDWIPEDSANTIFIMGYDKYGLGVRLEQRTYSWNYAYNDRYIFIDYKIKNMNSFPLDSVYVGYFMDNDIGQAGYEDPEGSNDDLIGYNRALNLGYTYDSNGSEPGWKYPAGYIGSVFCRTPRDIGMTGFQSWTREGQENQVDNTDRDDLKYGQLACSPGNPPDYDTDPEHQFESFTVPRDVRQLMASGPFRLEARGDSLGRDQVTVGFAIVCGDDLEELETNAKMAIEQYNAGYMGPEAPPSPDLTLTPADGKVYLSWNDYPESTVDPLTKEQDFEGYRVYKNATGSPMDWNLLPGAEYDVVGSRTEDKVVVEKKAGPSSAQVEFEEFEPAWKTLFNLGQSYRIEFTSDSDFEVRNYSTQHILPYNSKARSDPEAGGGYGFCVFGWRGIPDLPYPTCPDYSDSTRIYFDGMYLMIHDDTTPGAGQPSPMSEDLFAVTAYPSEAMGSQSGLRYSYVDDDVINGMTYYYCVTSYDQGDPSAGLVSLEGGKTLEHSVVPGPLAEDQVGGKVTNILHIAGSGPEPDSAVMVDVVQPVDVTGHTYRVEFLAADTSSDRAGYWRLRDVDLNQVLLDSMISIWGDTLENGDPIPKKPVVDGLCLTISGLSDSTAEGAPFSTSDIYEFGTLKLTAKKADYSLDRIKVVPNPYIIRTDWDRSRFDQWLNFNHLPAKCTIRIFTPSGLLIKTLRHSATGANSGVERWNLRTEEGMNCVSGLYLYQVKAEDGKTKMGKFAIIR